MSFLRVFPALAVLVGLAASGALAADAVNEYRLPLMTKTPVIDGRLDPDEWSLACGFDGLAADGRLEERSARAWIGATETDLYVALESELPKEGKLLAAIDRDAAKIVYDDAMEVLVDPQPGEARGTEFRVLASAGNRRAYVAVPRGGAPEAAGWDGGCDIRHGFTADRWVTEMRIPLAKVAPGRTATSGTWGITVSRDWKQPWALASTGAGYRPESARFSFVAGGLAVQHRHLADPFARNLQMQFVVHNPGPAAVAVHAVTALKRNLMPEATDEQLVTVPPGASKAVDFRLKEESSTAFDLSLRVASADGKTVYYSRAYAWGKPRDRRWDTTAIALRPLDFRFSHYPYLHKLRILADVSGLPADAVLESATLTLRAKGQTQAVGAWKFDQFKAGKQEAILDVPDLSGVYEIVMVGKGRGVPAEPVVKTLERKRFEWEGKGLGTGTKVYPPFTPIRLEGKTLRTVLREHTLNDLGLLDQVTAGQPGEEKPILAAPMTLKAVVDGAETPVRAQPLAFSERAGHRVVTQSAITAGALRGQATATWEYDGAVKYDLVLEPTGGRSLDRLTLEIPLKGDMAPMIHAMGDLLRNTVSEALPAGEGVVWDARKVSCSALPANFCSYVFVGSPQRGLSWFAENDRGWSWDRQTPNLEIIRQGGQVVLRVHLVNKPLVIAAPRKLSFGLLAAPVKPRLEGWRHRWWTDRYAMLGTCINWLGGPGSCGNVYPPGKDPYFWQMIARGNTERVPKADIEECIRKGVDYFKTLDYVPYAADKLEDAVESWKRHVYHNVGGSRYQTTMVFYYNRATYNACEEYPTFMDEWVRDDYNSRDFKHHAGEIQIVPSPSYIDYALWWYAQSFKQGRNRGVYWDNWFFNPTYNRPVSDAYVDETGKVVPATGVWAMRELVKRTFVMMNDLGMTPITMPHMTSTNILPAHAFATVQYDWEWKYSEGDVQGRFTRPYILLCSNGELAGMWPVMLGDHGALVKDEWTQRTFAGVCLVHELISEGPGAVWKTLRDPLIPLMQNPKTRVYRYWDEAPQPVQTGRPDLPAIVYSVPGEQTLAVLCSYSERDEQATLRIDPKALGLAAGYKVSNLETGAPYAVEQNQVRLNVRKHEVIGLRIGPR